MITPSSPFSALYAHLNSGTAVERYAARPSFPLLMDIELTNHCNFSCRMCTTGMHVSPRPRGYMSERHFKTILREAEAHGTALRFIRWGEPTLHRHWLEWLHQAHLRGLLVHFNTNGFLLKEKHFYELVDKEIDSVKFSFQGVDAPGYHQMRGKDFFDQLLLKIKKLHDIRSTKARPHIHISTTVTTESQTQVTRFLRQARAVADTVNVGTTDLNRVPLELFPEKEREDIAKLRILSCSLHRPAACNEVFAKLSVDWDGNVTACCADNSRALKVGHLDEASITEIWNSDRMRYFQATLAANHFEKLALCRNCYEVMPLE